ncbi:hypothetical protein DI09_5p570 [Mitosporidium daphniae]|uniref:Uncharacterized protein n=1 Tax=Mitosporidium daphniae TaxID=1485682 RepID=A0A098VP19_9MICR|nr:uncharacterized protein DI09_5p570 [Mitosporidium daphniae]KGG50710.1 hypothetical protein DI09_5p570 [Mitosporidium daphniae]|eukprot:XP_013237137.1 uncharacterized protein DI09_5p570 [Mitosporidium daphniae]
MDTPLSAQEAIKELNGSQLAGDTITVELAKSEVEGGVSDGGVRRSSFRRFDNNRYYPDSDRPRPFRNGPDVEEYGRRNYNRYDSRDGLDSRNLYERGRYEYGPRDRFDPRGERDVGGRRGGMLPPPPPPGSGSSVSASYNDPASPAPSGALRMDREMRGGGAPPHYRPDEYYPPPGDYRGRDGFNARRRAYSPPGGFHERPPSMRYPPEDDRYDYPRRGGYGPGANPSEFGGRNPPEYEPSRRGTSEEDGSRRYRDNRSRSPASRFDNPRSPPTSNPSSRFEQPSSIAPGSDAQRTSSWGSGYSSPSRRTQGSSFNNDDVRSPSPVAQYYEDM